MNYSPEELREVEELLKGDLHEFNGSIRTIGYNYPQEDIDWETVIRLTTRRNVTAKAAKTLGIQIESPERII